MIYLLILLLLLLLIICYQYKLKIDINSFFHKGVNINNGIWGTYVFHGFQGQGKTASVVKFITFEHPELKLYSNLKSYTGRDYKYIANLDELLKIDDTNCIIFYDEIFTEITKSTKLTKEFLAFLAQMRKKHNIFVTTCQAWLELPVNLRRFVRFDIKCKTYSFLGKGFLLETYENAEEMKWSTLDNEYIAPIIAMKLSKYNKRVVDMYDTWEVIGTSALARGAR